MPMIYDGGPPRWVEPVKRKRRRKPRALRFAGLSAGAYLVQRGRSRAHVTPAHSVPVANDDDRFEERETTVLALVEDRWFDPVAGQHDATAGEMASIRYLQPGVGKVANKYPFTLRGLAQNGFEYATTEEMAVAARIIADGEERQRLVEAIARGEVEICAPPAKRERTRQIARDLTER